MGKLKIKRILTTCEHSYIIKFGVMIMYGTDYTNAECT